VGRRRGKGSEGSGRGAGREGTHTRTHARAHTHTQTHTNTIARACARAHTHAHAHELGEGKTTKNKLPDAATLQLPSLPPLTEVLKSQCLVDVLYKTTLCCLLRIVALTMSSSPTGCSLYTHTFIYIHIYIQKKIFI
jgi:hypothetical protein